jgi:Sortase domain
MARSSRARRFLTTSALALSLAIGTVSGAVGRDAIVPQSTVAIAAEAAAPAPTGEVLAAESQVTDATSLGTGNAGAPVVGPAVPVIEPGLRPTPRMPTVRPAAEAKVASAGDPAGTSKYKGRNHIWMPSLRIDRSVASYSCSNKSYPGNRVYRWGCAGKNNVYLFGHAHSVFRPLHDAYVKGRLKKGAKLYYADSNGRVRAYKVAWWKVTTPTKGTWAYAAQAKPSLTLQTCVGSRSQYRLIVRLVRID